MPPTTPPGLLGYTRDTDPLSLRLRTTQSPTTFFLFGLNDADADDDADDDLANPPTSPTYATPSSTATLSADADDDDIFSSPPSPPRGSVPAAAAAAAASTNPTTSAGTGYTLLLAKYGGRCDTLVERPPPPPPKRAPSSVDGAWGSGSEAEEEERKVQSFLVSYAGAWVGGGAEDQRRKAEGRGVMAAGRKGRKGRRGGVVLHQAGGGALGAEGGEGDAEERGRFEGGEVEGGWGC